MDLILILGLPLALSALIQWLVLRRHARGRGDVILIAILASFGVDALAYFGLAPFMVAAVTDMATAAIFIFGIAAVGTVAGVLLGRTLASRS